ncbi:MAG: hypothetical protein HRT61_00290 [Ekhidna sp.]|nr:hypothetical protein [Ekhidna sp.]
MRFKDQSENYGEKFIRGFLLQDKKKLIDGAPYSLLKVLYEEKKKDSQFGGNYLFVLIWASQFEFFTRDYLTKTHGWSQDTTKRYFKAMNKQGHIMRIGYAYKKGKGDKAGLFRNHPKAKARYKLTLKGRRKAEEIINSVQNIHF